jgi:hypothetical protein
MAHPDRMSRKRSCEVCGEASGALTSIDSDLRRVVLCQAHAESAQREGTRSVEALRALFVEAEGRRALLARRAEDERRMFPPRPEGRRLSRGRRKSDAPRPRSARAPAMGERSR